MLSRGWDGFDHVLKALRVVFGGLRLAWAGLTML